MESWNYNLEEMVRLIVPAQDAEMMRLADAVSKVMHMQDQALQRGALIVQDGKAVLNFEEISAVYRRANFPK